MQPVGHPRPGHQHEALAAVRAQLRVLLRGPATSPASSPSASSTASSPGASAPRSSTTRPTTRRPTGCASTPRSTSARCARSTCRRSSASSPRRSRGRSCAPTTRSTACPPRRTPGCSPTRAARGVGLRGAGRVRLGRGLRPGAGARRPGWTWRCRRTCGAARSRSSRPCESGEVPTRSLDARVRNVLELVDQGHARARARRVVRRRRPPRAGPRGRGRVGRAAEERRRCCRCAADGRRSPSSASSPVPRGSRAPAARRSTRPGSTSPSTSCARAYGEVPFAAGYGIGDTADDEALLAEARRGRRRGRHRGHGDRAARRRRVRGLRPHPHEPAGQPARRPAGGRRGQPERRRRAGQRLDGASSATSPRMRRRWSRPGSAVRPPAARSPTCCPARSTRPAGWPRPSRTGWRTTPPTSTSPATPRSCATARGCSSATAATTRPHRTSRSRSGSGCPTPPSRCPTSTVTTSWLGRRRHSGRHRDGHRDQHRRPATGAEVVQVYVRDVESSVARPDPRAQGIRQGLAWTPVQSEQVTCRRWTSAPSPSGRSLHGRWVVEAGEFAIEVGPSLPRPAAERNRHRRRPEARRAADRDSTLHEWMADPTGRTLIERCRRRRPTGDGAATTSSIGHRQHADEHPGQLRRHEPRPRHPRPDHRRLAATASRPVAGRGCSL